MRKQSKNSVNLEIPNRWRRSSAFLLDVLFTITIIGGLINLIILFKKDNSLGNIITGIKVLNNDGSEITNKQKIIRYSLIFPMSISFSFIIYLLMMFLGFIIQILLLPVLIINSLSNNSSSDPVNYLAGICGILILIFIIIVLVINIIEIFQPCPTFIDKRLGIKRVYKKSK